MTGAITHYGTEDLVGRVAAVLGDAPMTPEALAPLDQFHVGGAAATADLAAKLGIAAGAAVLDVGSGLGGPARYLAATYDCSVTGIDLNQPFVDLAVMLTARAGLSGRVRHVFGDATRLPFEPDSFDYAWTQHVAMNIADRPGLYAGIHRVLRPGGRLAMYDVAAGEAGPLHFPVPWARDPADSFLLAPDATRAVLEAAGFEIVDWVDATAAGMAWFQAQSAAAQARPNRLKALALPLVMGPDFPAMAANLGRNLREGRARLLQGIVRKPG